GEHLHGADPGDATPEGRGAVLVALDHVVAAAARHAVVCEQRVAEEAEGVVAAAAGKAGGSGAVHLDEDVLAGAEPAAVDREVASAGAMDDPQPLDAVRVMEHAVERQRVITGA